MSEYPLTPEQFDALAKFIRRAAYEAAGSATHQPRARDNTDEWYARATLTGDYSDSTE